MTEERALYVAPPSGISMQFVKENSLTLTISVNAGLESPANRQTRMSAPHRNWSAFMGFMRALWARGILFQREREPEPQRGSNRLNNEQFKGGRFRLPLPSGEVWGEGPTAFNRIVPPSGGWAWGRLKAELHARLVRLITFLFFGASLFAAEPKRVVVLGDSLAAGYGVDAEEAYPALLQQKVEAAQLPFVVVNAGVSGDTTAGGLRRMDWILKQPVDVLVVELGGNDGLRGIPVAQTRTNLQAIIDRAKAKDSHVGIVIAGMKMPANMGANYTEEFEKVFSEIAKKNGAALIPFLLEGVAADAELNQADRIHPTAAGHKILAENVWKILEPILKARKGTDAPEKK